MAEKKPETNAAGALSSMNPAGLAFLFSAFKVVAKVLKVTGAIDYLKEQAEKTETELDDKVIRIVEQMLKIMGE